MKSNDDDKHEEQQAMQQLHHTPNVHHSTPVTAQKNHDQHRVDRDFLPQPRHLTFGRKIRRCNQAKRVHVLTLDVAIADRVARRRISRECEG